MGYADLPNSSMEAFFDPTLPPRFRPFLSDPSFQKLWAGEAKQISDLFSPHEISNLFQDNEDYRNLFINNEPFRVLRYCSLRCCS